MAAPPAPPSRAPPRRRVFGVNFTPLGLDEVLRFVVGRPPEDPFGYVVTPNAQHVVLINHFPERMGPIYHDHSLLCVCDSQVVRRLSAMAGAELPACAGSDLTAALLGAHMEPGDAVTVIGCEPEVMERVRAMFPAVRFKHHNPPMGFASNSAEVARCVDFVECHPARYVLFTVGTPRGEELAHRIAGRGQATGIGLCVGGSLHFLAGMKKRAPAWVRARGLEWLYRLLHEPRRLWRRVFLESMPVLAIAAPEIGRRLLPRAARSGNTGLHG